MTMPAGEYYVGDLCYVVHDRWEEFCAVTIKDERCLSGEFVFPDGVRFAVYDTIYGDGEYPDQDGNLYPVDSGAIGCILIQDINEECHINIQLGRRVKFDQEFQTGSNAGILTFGSISINTDFIEGDYYDDEDGDDDGDDEDDNHDR